MEILTAVGKEASKMVGDMMYPGTGRVFSVVFNWVMSLVKRIMMRENFVEANESEDDEQERLQEDDPRKAEIH